VLVTGGTGGLGAVVARHLAEAHGARRLLLVSRRGAEADGAEELVRELAELGCEAEVAACDVADREQLAALLARRASARRGRPRRRRDRRRHDRVARRRALERVLRPKLDAALNLHELTRDWSCRDFVLFSSAAATSAAGAGQLRGGERVPRRAGPHRRRARGCGERDRVGACGSRPAG
jgi:NAD(P)-dependent dehydrogenase (short-subunit alcohol dehydrogenase family)